jgi:hypothetical protein
MIHRNEQWDLGQSFVKPILCLHHKMQDKSKRILVFWKNGFRGFGLDIRWKTT